MNLIALELYRLRLEVSANWRWGYKVLLSGRYAWVLALGFIKVGWVYPRLQSQDPAITYAQDTIRGLGPSRRVKTTRGGMPIIR